MTLPILVFEAIVALVVLGGAIMCWRVDRRLQALRTGSDGVAKAVADLALATQRAEAALQALKLAQDTAGADLEDRIVKARAVADELHFLSDAPRSGRQRPPAQSAPEAERPKFGATGLNSEAARILETLKGAR